MYLYLQTTKLKNMSEKKINTERIINEGGIELLVTYEFTEHSDAIEFHGTQEIRNFDVEIINIEMVIANESVRINGEWDMSKGMSSKQLDEIKSNLEIY